MLGGTRRHGTRNTKPASSISRTQIKVRKAGSNSINLDEAQTAPLPHCALGEFQSFLVEEAGVESSLGTGFRALTGSYGLLRALTGSYGLAPRSPSRGSGQSFSTSRYTSFGSVDSMAWL